MLLQCAYSCMFPSVARIQLHALNNELKIAQSTQSTHCTDGTPCSPLESAHPLWTFDSRCRALRQYHICDYVIPLKLISQIWWYTLTLWAPKWGQSLGQNVTESMRRLKTTNYEIEEKERKERDGDVGGEGRGELTWVVIGECVRLIELDTHRQAALTVQIKMHSSSLSLICPYCISSLMLHFSSSFWLFFFFYYMPLHICVCSPSRPTLHSSLPGWGHGLNFPSLLFLFCFLAFRHLPPWADQRILTYNQMCSSLPVLA